MLRVIPPRAFLTPKNYMTAFKAQRVRGDIGILSLVSPRAPYPAFATDLYSRERRNVSSLRTTQPASFDWCAWPMFARRPGTMPWGAMSTIATHGDVRGHVLARLMSTSGAINGDEGKGNGEAGTRSDDATRLRAGYSQNAQVDCLSSYTKFLPKLQEVLPENRWPLLYSEFRYHSLNKRLFY